MRVYVMRGGVAGGLETLGVHKGPIERVRAWLMEEALRFQIDEDGRDQVEDWDGEEILEVSDEDASYWLIAEAFELEGDA